LYEQVFPRFKSKIMLKNKTPKDSNLPFKEKEKEGGERRFELGGQWKVPMLCGPWKVLVLGGQ
jgi:hypothetical protein